MVPSGAAKTIDLETWFQQQKAGLVGGLNGAYLDIARELGAGVAPVGIAWKMALAADPPFVLHRKDKSHPNPTGTYLAACVFCGSSSIPKRKAATRRKGFAIWSTR
jgi:hypothetical protein